MNKRLLGFSSEDHVYGVESDRFDSIKHKVLICCLAQFVGQKKFIKIMSLFEKKMNDLDQDLPINKDVSSLDWLDLVD